MTAPEWLPLGFIRVASTFPFTLRIVICALAEPVPTPFGYLLGK